MWLDPEEPVLLKASLSLPPAANASTTGTSTRNRSNTMKELGDTGNEPKQKTVRWFLPTGCLTCKLPGRVGVQGAGSVSEEMFKK